jgi:hypothetical protein
MIMQKMKRRRSAVEKKKSWSREYKLEVDAALKIAYMSSEDEVDDGETNRPYYRISHLPWRSEQYGKVMDQLDLKAASLSNRKGPKVVRERNKDNISARPAPLKIPERQAWVFHIPAE